MNELKVLTVFGTRPEAVKLAPVIRELEKHPEIDSRVCVTAQHREMLDQVLDLFQIHPHYDLNLMKPDQSLAEITAAIMMNLDPLLEQLQPDWILIQGDTSTVVATALLAFYRQIRVGHVEAGLRTGDKWQPFPEEINRKVAGVIADLHFAPTEENRKNLLKEGIPPESIVVTGNPVIDALDIIRAEPEPDEVKKLLVELGISEGGRRLVLVTAHRRENFGQPLDNICAAIAGLAEHYRGEVEFVYPVHLNPNVQKPVREKLSGIENIKLIAAAGLPATGASHETCHGCYDRFGRYPGGGSRPGYSNPGSARGDRAPRGHHSRYAQAGRHRSSPYHGRMPEAVG